jgi:two-component system response regulator FimZ (fimbrial Z protein)
VKEHIDSHNIVIFSRNYYALNAVRILVSQTLKNVTVIACVSDTSELDDILSGNEVHIVILVECNQDMADSYWFRYASVLKKTYPHLFLCLCSSQSTSLPLLRRYIDSYFFLNDSISKWQSHIRRFLEKENARPKNVSNRLNLSEIEWAILKGIKGGDKLQHIAENNNLSYRRVSALKNVAIRKLGLRNKTELLVFLAR